MTTPADENTREWRSVVTSPVLVGASVVLGVATAVVLVWWLVVGGDLDFVVILLALVLATGFVSASARVVVTVGASGLTAASAFFGFHWTRLELDDIADARVDTVSLGSWFGWGYRASLGGSALLLVGRRALVVELVTGREFTITLPDPEWALAALLAAADARGDVAGPGSLDLP
ncbi:hypothetical protein [Frondihabitans australicus]|uniref:Uncharacterized protein n=1 Tax=Frondihabitans australicus TaxID=386892 RepID=A0A495IIV9_9MICO|nr:hypothetical protein [Frondihabitans australicus]RKR75065.1 hypothetical protein C8E83_2202 [Frondihabitans australicus]